MEGTPIRYRLLEGTRHAATLARVLARNERIARRNGVNDSVRGAWLKVPRWIAAEAAMTAVVGYSADVIGNGATSGRPTGWASTLPDPRALPQHESRVKRSRKGRATLAVGRRAEHRFITGAFDRTVDGLPIVESPDWLDPERDSWPAVDVVTGPDESRAARLRGERNERARIERRLVAAADALLTRAEFSTDDDDSRQVERAARRKYRLTDAPWLQGERGEMRRTVVDGGAVPSDHRRKHTDKDGNVRDGARYRGSRGCDGWSISVPDADRALAWCDHHRKPADRCRCAVSHVATVGNVAHRNEGTAPRDNGTSIADAHTERQTIPAHIRPDRIVGVEVLREIRDPNTGNVRRVYGRVNEDGTEALLSYGENGTVWVGHERATIRATARRNSTRVARKAAGAAAQTLAQRRADITTAALAILATGHGELDDGTVIAALPGKRTMTYRAYLANDPTQHIDARTPAALADKVARAIA